MAMARRTRRCSAFTFDQMSMSPLQRKVVLAAVPLIIAMAILAFPSSGGNVAALHACKQYALSMLLWSHDEYAAARHTPTDRQILQWLKDTEQMTVVSASRIHPARLLVRLDGWRINSATEKRIVAVCNRSYASVPQRWFGRFSAKAHAVAYSTGETGLISPVEFARMDLSGFVDFKSTVETMKVEP